MIKPFKLVFLILSSALIWAGCSPTSLLHEAPSEPSPGAEYSVVIYIHGDGDYLYHADSGEPVRADENALQKAQAIADEAKTGEIVIFHRRPGRSFLGLFPRRTSRMHVYRNGALQTGVAYRQKGDQGRFMKEESELFEQYTETSGGTGNPVYFIYFGHEIPNRPEKGYHRSAPEREWGTTLFADEIETFLSPDQERFNLVALSTCSNGTPEMAVELRPVSQFLLASPQNLHLSHLDLNKLSLLEEDPRYRTDTHLVANALAEDSFSRLSDDVHTAVTLSVYDLDTLSDSLKLNELNGKVERYKQNQNLNYSRDNIDCAEFLDAEWMTFREGMKTFYRAPRFGSRAGAGSHSGWGCKPGI